MIKNATRIEIRITTLLRGKLAEDAGPYGSLSRVARTILEAHYARRAMTPRKGKK